ncbi:MAG: nuclear transport factor 2 family protein [Thermoleophilia bacterium]
MGAEASAESVVRAFLDAFARNDLAAMRALLGDAFAGTITTADGGTVRVDAGQYLASVAAMDVPTAGLRVDVTDATPVGDDGVLMMLEVHAARGGRTLHNFSGQLAHVRDGRLSSLVMVDARPEESDRFCAA